MYAVLISPLNIEETVSRYCLDDELKAQLFAFDRFVWQDCMIESIDQLVAFEKQYQAFDSVFDLLYDTEYGEYTHVEMHNGTMSYLGYGCYHSLASAIQDQTAQDFMKVGLTDLETVILRSFRANISGLYRLDAYHFGIPPFIKSVSSILNNALSKLPIYNNEVVRDCLEFDRIDFKVGDVFKPSFCLTTSADLNWKVYSDNRYRIKPLDSDDSKARALFLVNFTPEKQVTFLEDAFFRIVGINDWGEGKKEFVMEELIEKHGY